MSYNTSRGLRKLLPAEQKTLSYPMPVGDSKAIPDAVIKDLLGSGFSHSEWRTRLLGGGHTWNRGVELMMIREELQFFKAEIQYLRSQPDSFEYTRSTSNSFQTITKRLKGEIWAPGVADEREERKRARRLLGKDANFRTIVEHAKRWDLEASSSASIRHSHIPDDQGLGESTSSQRTKLGVQVPPPLMKAPWLDTNYGSRAEWESYKGLIETLYMTENYTLRRVMDFLLSKHGFVASQDRYRTKLREWGFVRNRRNLGKVDDVAMTKRNVQVQHTDDGSKEVVCSQSKPETPRLPPMQDGWDMLSQDTRADSKGSQPSPTTESLEDSLDSDMFSISDSTEDIELPDQQDPVYPILQSILNELIAGFRTVIQHPHSVIDGRGRYRNLASKASSSQPSSTSRSSQKRALPQEEEDGNDEDGSRPPPSKRMKSGHGKKPLKYFACPYMKRDPGTFKECGKLKLSRISDVKTHLRRKHSAHHYCPLCQEIFPDDESCQGHIEDRNCSRQDPIMLMGVSSRQHQQLHKKSDSDASEEEKWYKIWEILFPQRAKPPSVYIDNNLVLVMQQFRAYCDNRGPALMRGYFESNSEQLNSESTAEQRGAYLEGVFAQGISILIEDWISNGSSTTSSPSHLLSDSAQQSQYETPTSEVMYSGGASGARPSSRENNSHASEFHPAFAVAAAQPTVDSHTRRPWALQASARDLLLRNAQSHPFLPSGSEMEGHENRRDWEYRETQNLGSDRNMLNDWDMDPFLTYEHMPDLFPEPGQEGWAGDPSK